jgi:DNA-binding Lrp family transcriptional regulator
MKKSLRHVPNHSENRCKFIFRRRQVIEKILQILETNARSSVDEIALQIGATPDQVKDEIKKAEEERVILKYKALVDWSKLGKQKVMALVEIKATPRDNKNFDDIAASIYKFKQVRSVYLASGTYDMAVLVTGESMQDVAVFVSEKLALLNTIQGTVTHFILKKYKEDGEVL